MLAQLIPLLLSVAATGAPAQEQPFPESRYAVLQASEGEIPMEFQPSTSWEPTAEQIQAALTSIWPYVEPRYKGRWVPLPPADEYRYQLIPGQLEGQNKLYVNAFCTPDEHWKERVVLALDGGPCYFQVYYDPATGSFEGLSFNGVA